MKKNFSIIVFVIALCGATIAQSKEEVKVRGVLDENTAAFVRNDIASLDKIWANDEAVTVFENGYANYGWLDYRNNHLAPEMKEFKDLKYSIIEPKIKIAGKTAWATFKYKINGEANGRRFDSGGLGTAILENRKGTWVIVHWHTSAPRRPASTPSPS